MVLDTPAGQEAAGKEADHKLVQAEAEAGRVDPAEMGIKLTSR